MTSPLTLGYWSNNARTEGEGKQAIEDVNSVTKELPGGIAASELTIASGVITPTGWSHTVDTQSDAATDDLDNAAVTNHPDGRLLMLTQENSARIVTIRHAQGGSGQFQLRDGVNYELTGGRFIIFERVGTDWEERWRSDFDSAFATIEDHTADDTLLESESGSIHTNNGAAGTVILTLPPAQVGIRFTILVRAAQTLRVLCPSGDKIRVEGVLSAAAGNAESATIGDALILACFDGTEYVAIGGANLSNWTVT